MKTDDMELVREYAKHSSEKAFATLVERHVNLVYSVALHQLRDASLAEEVTQAAFIILARKAGSLGPKTILSAWLCRTAQYAAANALRTERRRQCREQEAYMQSVLNEPQTETSPWPDIAPLLNNAMAELGEKYHSAIVLRFFEGKDLKQVGAELGVDQRTAQTRVRRGVEKLHRFFVKRGISLSAAAIGGAISANAVQAAPVELAKSVSALAVAKGAAASGSTLTLIKGALKIMAWTKAKTAIIVAITVLLLGGGATIATLTRTKAAQGQSTGKITSWVTGGTGTGRQVKAAGDVSLGILSGGGAVTVRLGDRGVDAVGKIIPDHTVIVETEQALLDGKAWAQIPASATAVDIVYANQTLSIAADKKLLFAAKLNK